MDQILEEPLGSEITMLDIKHPRLEKGSNAKDTIFIVYRNHKHEKKVKVITEPKVDIYFVLPEYRSDFMTPREYIEKEKCYCKTVKYSNVIKTVAAEIEKSDDPISKYYYQVYNTYRYDRRKVNEILKWPYTLFSDVDIVSYYWIMIGIQYNLSGSHYFNRAYLDIESDIYKLGSYELDHNKDKTSACTVIFTYDQNLCPGKISDVYTFLLRNHKRFPQQQHFEEHLKEFEKQCHDEFDVQTVTKKGKERKMDMPAKYHIKLYDSEAEELTAIFSTINKIKPDTIAIWNFTYDIPKMMARMQDNNLNYNNIMCDSDYFTPTYRSVYVHDDKRSVIDMANKNSTVRMSSTTNYTDDMLNYAAIRKGQKSYGSNKLDNIAKIELGMGKRTFGKGIDVTNAAIKDYWNFVLYNITDVWRQVLIDIVTNDTMSMIYDMNQMNCPMENLTKQTRYQKQIYYSWYLRKGFIPGNNINANYLEDIEDDVETLKAQKKEREALDREALGLEEPEEEEEDFSVTTQIIDEMTIIFEDSPDKEPSLSGGLVGNPNNNLANGIDIVKDSPSKHFFDRDIDMDYASEYPWAKFTRSLSRSTQIGRLIIPKKVSDRQFVLPLGQQKRPQDVSSYLPGAEFTADYLSDDIISFGNTWFHLPTIEELDKELRGKV